MPERPDDPEIENDDLRIWERPEPKSRPAPSPLSRERIVRAAIGIADREGLAAVSLRNVGAALDTGAMRLYGYISTKEELLDLMVDAVHGEMLRRGPPPGDWREALRAMAQATRQAALRHGWFADLLGGRPHQGPNALAHLEASLAALHGPPGFEDIDAVLLAARTVHAYVIGATRSEFSERNAERESGLDKAGWQAANGPYIYRMIATGRFPTIARVVDKATHPPDDVVFEQGLDLVLAGIAARLSG